MLNLKDLCNLGLCSVDARDVLERHDVRRGVALRRICRPLSDSLHCSLKAVPHVRIDLEFFIDLELSGVQHTFARCQKNPFQTLYFEEGARANARHLPLQHLIETLSLEITGEQVVGEGGGGGGGMWQMSRIHTQTLPKAEGFKTGFFGSFARNLALKKPENDTEERHCH